MAAERLEDAQAAMAPLRQQAEHARASVGAFESRLAGSAERSPSPKRARRSCSRSCYVRASWRRASADVVIDAEAQLSAARAEIAGWRARQDLLLSQLTAERDAGGSRRRGCWRRKRRCPRSRKSPSDKRRRRWVICIEI